MADMYRAAQLNKLKQVVTSRPPTTDLQEAFALKRKMEAIGGTWVVQKVTQAFLDAEDHKNRADKDAYESRRPAWRDGE